MNWSLPNKILNEIWKMRGNQIAANRCNFHRDKALFRHSKRSTISEHFLPLVKAEEENAAVFFQSKLQNAPITND